MSVTEASRQAVSGAIAAGVPKVHTLALGGATAVAIILRNTGSADIESVVIERSPLGTEYATDTALGTAIGAISAGASKLVEGAELACAFVRVTLNSSAGTNYSLEMRGGF